MANAVYDPDTEGEQRYHPPNLDPLDNKPAGNPSDPRDSGSQGDLRDAENSGGLYNPSGDSQASSGSSGGLLDREKGASGTAGGGNFSFNSSDKGGRGRVGSAMQMAAKHKKKMGIGVGVGGGIAGVVLMIFFLLIPLKIEHIVTNLEKRFFATSENALDRESRKMFTRYMTKHVLPGYRGKCGTTIEKTCSINITGKGPVSNLYRSWANAKLENKLAKNFGIEFRYDTPSKSWYMKAPGTNVGKGDRIGEFGQGLDTDFQRHDRAALRAAVSDAFDKETRWRKIMYRYKVGRLLEEKYGLKRCIIFCGARDQLSDKKDAKTKAAKLYLVQRVITPRFETVGTVMECLIQACDPTKTQPISAEDGSTSQLAGSPENPDTDSTIRSDSNRLAQKFVGEGAEEMLSSYKVISEKGFQRYFLEELLKKIGLKEIASNVSDAVPIVGWVNRAATVITWINHAGPGLKKLGYIANAGAAVQLYQMYSTYADEIHTGHADATEVGSLTDSLSPGNRGTSADPQVGGTAGAESTPLYANLIDGKSPTRTTAFGNLLPGSAWAASNKSSGDYKCSGNKPVPAGKLVCPEEVLGGGNNYLDGVHTALNTPPLSVITQLADAWHSLVGSVLGTVGSIFGSALNAIPGVSQLVNSVSSFVSNIVQPFFTFLTDKLLPNPWGTNMSGGRTFDLMAAGADVAGNDYAHTGLGGKRLNPQQVASIVNEQQDLDRQKFDSKPLFARMFDTGSSYSLVTKLAMSIPIGTQAQARSGLANLLSPLESIGRGFAALFSGRVLAAATAQPDPFGVMQYGYTSDDLNAIGDPETYWDHHCSDNASFAYMKTNAWNQAAAASDVKGADNPSGMPVNVQTNPCLLIKATVGVAGGLFDTSNLTADDLSDQTSTGTTTSPATTVDGAPQELAKALVDSGRLTDQDGRYMAQIKAVANGNFSCNVNPYILQMLYGVVVQDKHRVVMSSLNRYCTGVLTASGTGSYHYRDGGGHAIDVVGFDGGTVDGNHNSPTLGYLNEAVKYLPKGSGIGQVASCGSGFHIPGGDYPVPDTCNHQHIQVPVKRLAQ